ncbi:antitoxin [Haloferula sargassicola]|uniref:SpoVT-AbrB domain-containing protein n=1 Tax=Haloferula sargassicola TaxID=490096 RepID=A0ABP9ULR8_9BACT
MSQKTMVFKSGNSLAVRLPKDFRLPVGEVEIERLGSDIILRCPRAGWPEDFRERFTPDTDLRDWETPARETESDDLTW